MDTWPTTLPQEAFSQGFTQQEDPSVLRSTLGYGSDGVRLRDTLTPQKVKFFMRMTSTQLATLKTFYTDTVNRTLPFIWVDQTTQSTANYRFITSFNVKPKGLYWDVSFELEIVP